MIKQLYSQLPNKTALIYLQTEYYGNNNSAVYPEAFKDKYFVGEKFKSSQTLCNFVTMNIEELREYCLSFPHTTEDMPFDDETLVFKVGGKMFCFVSISGELRVNLKCDPDEALELREAFPSVLPGYHMNKKYWNTIIMDGSISDNMFKMWVEKSYRLVIAKLTKQESAQLGF